MELEQLKKEKIELESIINKLVNEFRSKNEIMDSEMFISLDEAPISEVGERYYNIEIYFQI